jgi:N-carbamoyl-L-amino-acid hydrolase
MKTGNAKAMAGKEARAGANTFGPRIMALVEHLAQWSEQNDALTVTYFSEAHKNVAAELGQLLRAAGMETRADAIGNVIGCYKASKPNAKTLLLGSHYDTVRDGGKYDGRLGILVPLALVEHLNRTKQRLPFNVELLCFSEEEGVRFPIGYLGSQVIAGKFDQKNLDATDDGGIPLRKVLEAANVDVKSISSLARRKDDLIGYVELHIEQGPSLLNADIPIAVVTGIAGAIRHRVVVEGEAGHAGTVAMQFRHDAGAAAAEMILAVEKRCAGIPSLVGTVGQLLVPNGAMNVIPGRCEFSTDIRASTNEVRDAAVKDVLAAFEEIAKRRGVKVKIEEVLRMSAIPLSPYLQERLKAAAERLGVSPLMLPSGAGHDAAMMSNLTEGAMVFVRCGNGGVSHSPLEIITEEDADFAARVLFDFLMKLAEEYNA